MNQIIEQTLLIEEKIKYYFNGQKVDFNFYKEWRNVNTLLNDKYFDIMLKYMNISKEEFAFTLQSDILKDFDIYEKWFKEFINILDNFNYEEINYNLGVYVATLPFTEFLKDTLSNKIKKLQNIKVAEKVIDSFIENHLLEMFNLTGKILALKLDDYKKTNKFNSKNSEDRFIEFLTSTFNSRDSYFKFYKEFPVLAKLIVIRTNYLLNNFIQILSRLDNDYKEVKQFFSIHNYKLSEIKLSIGDSHEQGKSVAILNFDNIKVVYKPKNLKISLAFEEFISWYTNKSNLLEIKLPKGIYKDNYTYNEFIEPKVCNNNIEIERFYIRYGYLIAISYLFSINDLHLENIIANGEYPVIIDIETSFQYINNFENSNVYSEIMRKLLIESVSNTCLLPTQLKIDNKESIELSAFNGKQVKLSKKYLSPIKINTDEFHYEKISGIYSPYGDNIPKNKNKYEVDIQSYKIKILEGFDEFINFILKNKEDLLKNINIFKGLKIRCLLKNTEKYVSMIRYSNHPNYNIEMKYRERLMMNLWAYPYLDKRPVLSEIKDLIFNDIPIFYSYTDSTSLIDSRGKVYKDYFENSGLNISKDRISNLTKEVIKEQQIILLTSLGLADNYLNENKKDKKIIYTTQHFNYIKQSKKITDELIENSILREEECSFININCDKNKHWELKPCNESLYNGLSGISILFLELYRETNQNKYLNYYYKIIQTAINQSKILPIESAFTGYLSPIYPIILEKLYFDNIKYIEYIKNIFESIQKLNIEDIRKIQGCDYISGISGIIKLLRISYNIFGEEYISKNIIDKFIFVFNERINSIEYKEFYQCGITHGISGIVLSLCGYENIEENLLKDMLHKEVELSIKQKDTKKWFSNLLSMIQVRLYLLKEYSSIIDKYQLEYLISQLENKLDTMLPNDTICYGVGSIAITLKMIFDETKDKKWIEKLNLLLTNMYLNSLYEDYSIPKIDKIKSKGLFDGISGIGWLYLYLEKSINNILLLETKNR